MSSPFAGRPRPRRVPVGALFLIAIVIVAGAVYGGYALATGNGSPAATAAASPQRLHVTDLMAKANCVGGLVGTQLYSYETGRCRLAGVDVTIAVFETGELRDQWLASARQFSGTLVAGVSWAAGMDKPDAAPMLAAALDGRVV